MTKSMENVSDFQLQTLAHGMIQATFYPYPQHADLEDAIERGA